MNRLGVALEVTLPDDIDAAAIARWIRKVIEQAPDVRDLGVGVFAVVVNGKLFVGDEEIL